MSKAEDLRQKAEKLKEEARQLEAQADKIEEPIVKLQKRVAELEKEVAELKNRSYIQIWNTYPPKDTFIPSYPYWRSPFWHLKENWPTVICQSDTSTLSTTQGAMDTTTNHLADFCSTQILANRL